VKVEDGEKLLKSPEIRRRACECSVCSLLVTDRRTSQAASALADGEIYTAIVITCENSHSR